MKMETSDDELYRLPDRIAYDIDWDGSIYYITYHGIFTPTKINSINYILQHYYSKNNLMRGRITVTKSESLSLVDDEYDPLLLRQYFINTSGNKDGEESIYLGLDDIKFNGKAVTCDILAQDKIYCSYGDNKEVTSLVMYWIDGRLVTPEEYATYYENVKQTVNASVSHYKIPFGNIVEQYLHH